MKKQRTYTSAFKAKVALETIKGLKTIQKISSEYEVHTTQLFKWKDTAMKNLDQLFEKNDGDKLTKLKETYELEIQKLHETIGKLTVENNFLKKKCSE